MKIVYPVGTFMINTGDSKKAIYEHNSFELKIHSLTCDTMGDSTVSFIAVDRAGNEIKQSIMQVRLQVKYSYTKHMYYVVIKEYKKSIRFYFSEHDLIKVG